MATRGIWQSAPNPSIYLPMRFRESQRVEFGCYDCRVIDWWRGILCKSFPDDAAPIVFDFLIHHISAFTAALACAGVRFGGDPLRASARSAARIRFS